MKKGCLEGDVLLMRYEPSRSRWARAQGLEILSQDDEGVVYSAGSSGLGYFAILGRPSKDSPLGGPSVASGSTTNDKAMAQRIVVREKDWESELEKSKKSSLSLEEEIASRQADRESARIAALASKKADQKRKNSLEIDELLTGQDKKPFSFWKVVGLILLFILLIAVIIAMVWYFNPSLMPPAWASWLGVHQNGQGTPLSNPPSGMPTQRQVSSPQVISNGTSQPIGPISSNNGIPDQVWRQDGMHSLDLSRYFSDPDSDALSYSNTPLRSIVIGYNASIATMTSLPDFVGEEQVAFIATDTSGSSARSNSVRLVVQPGRNSNGQKFLDFLKENTVYVITGLIALGVIILSIVMLRRHDDTEE